MALVSANRELMPDFNREGANSVQNSDTRPPGAICFIWNYLNWGGAQVYFLAIMKRSVGQRELHVLLPEGSSPDLLAFISQAGGKFEFLRYSLDAKQPNSLFGKIRRQFYRIRSEIEIFLRVRKLNVRSTAIHIELAPWQSWVLIFALRCVSAKVFVTVHNSLPNVSLFRRAIWRSRLWLISQLSGVRLFASNKFTKEQMAEWLSAKMIRKMPVTYTAVDPELIDSALANNALLESLRDKFGLRDKKTNILCVGQFINRKGRWVFLESAAILLRQFPDLRFLWLMPEPFDQETAARVATFGLQSAFLPVLSSDVGRDRLSILTFMRVADIFALPSYVEGLPIALLEAMALGIPSVSTEVYAIPEAIHPEKTGLLIKPGDPQQLADAIRRYLENPEFASEIAQAGRNFVLRAFDERDAADIVLRTYEEEFANG